jgi:hypothetical protein
MLAGPVPTGQVVVIDDGLGRSGRHRPDGHQRVGGGVQGFVLRWVPVAVKQRPLPGQPQVQFRAGLRHLHMLSRVAGRLGSVPVTRDHGPLVSVSP